MNDPTSMEELNARIMQNTEVIGYGLDVATVFACPWCATPGWKIVRVVHNDEDMMKIDTCSNCGRSGKIHIERFANSVRGEGVQTGGDDPPAWMHDPPRRIDPI